MPDDQNEDEPTGVADLIDRTVLTGPDPIDVLVELFDLAGGARIGREEIDVVGDPARVGLRKLLERLPAFRWISIR